MTSSTSAAAPRAKVVVIEPNLDERLLLCDALGFWGYDFWPAESGSEGLAWTIGVDPDVVLLDLTLPDVDVWTLLQQLQRLPATTPAIAAITSQDGPEVVHRARDAGVAMHFLKGGPLAPLREWLATVVHDRRRTMRFSAHRSLSAAGGKLGTVKVEPAFGA